MQSLTWSNGIGNRSRKPFLLFVKNDKVMVFTGELIPGICVVRGTDYTRSGKWSHTTYRLEVAPGVRVISGHDGWETGRFVEGLGAAVRVKTPDTWVETAEALGVSVPSCMDFLRSWKPKMAEKLDEVDQAMTALDEASADAENDPIIVTVSFGCPMNREIRNGYWDNPKSIPGYEGVIQKISLEKGWVEGNIKVVGIQGTVISVKHSSGHHGGYYAVSVAVIPGTEDTYN